MIPLLFIEFIFEMLIFPLLSFLFLLAVRLFSKYFLDQFSYSTRLPINENLASRFNFSTTQPE